VCLEAIQNFVTADPTIAAAFFQGYFLSILQDTFFVLTDTDHKSGVLEWYRLPLLDLIYDTVIGFKLQTQMLQKLFHLVESNTIQAPLFDPTTVPNPSMTNQQFLREYSANLLKNAFPHLTP